MKIIRINNRNNFLLKEIPSIHPKSIKYIQYWKEQKQRCIEGFWSIDDADINVDVDKPSKEIQELKSSKWRYMTPNLYFYVNFGIILHKPKDAPKTAPKKKIRPHLRDIEWEFFYNWLECRGFSGFEDDEIYSCNTSLINFQENNKLPVTCYNKKGEVKQYIAPRDYLRQLFDKPMGLPLYENDAKGLTLFGTRGGGKSFWAAVGVLNHELLFDSARRYDEDSRKYPYKVELLVGSGAAGFSSDLLSKAKEAMANLPGEWGKDTEDYEPAPFTKRMAGTLSPNNKKNKWRHEYEEKIGTEWVTKGSGSNITHVVYTVDNSEAGAGGRYTASIVEEQGLVPNLLEIHGSNTATLVDSGTKFGSELYLGTGGNVEKSQAAEVIFRNPEGFDMLALDDEWEGSGKIGFFLPSYMTLDEFKDENGNTDQEAAKVFREAKRTKARKAKSKSAIDLELMNFPMIPSEMFLNAKGSRFPIADLKQRLGEVKTKPHIYENAHYFVDFHIKEGKIGFDIISNHNLVREWPIIDNSDKPGVIEIFEMPKKDSKGEVFQGRYIQGTDTYDDDESQTSSLGSTFVFDLWTNRIVAEFTGRPMTKEFYEICRRLNIFYRTTHNYENNKKGLYTYYDQKNSVHLLCDTPESLKDISDYTISKIGNKSKGTNMTSPIIAYAMRLLEAWLLEPAHNADGEVNEDITNLDRIRSIGLLNELINYRPEQGNYDRISALLMIMILKEDMHKVTENRKKKKVETLSEDPFFNKYKQSSNLNNNISNNANTFLSKFGLSE